MINATTPAPATLRTKLPWGVTDATSTAEEMIVRQKMDWKAEKVQLFDADMKKVVGVYGVRRSDTMKCFDNVSVGARYTLLTNREKFSFMDSILQEGAGANYEQAGVFKNGIVTFIVAKLKGVMRIKDSDDEIESRLLCADWYDGTHKMLFGLISTRIYCYNSLMSAIKGAQSVFEIGHTASITAKAETARESLKLVNIQNEELKAKFDALADVNVTTNTLKAYGESIGFKPDSDKISDRDEFRQFVRAFETSPGNNRPTARGTMWGAFNAYTWMIDHGTEYKKRGDQSGVERRAYNALIGRGNDEKIVALEKALALV